MSIAIQNARIFDGGNILKAGTVVIENGLISEAGEASITIDASGCTLLPGLIDSHAHLYDKVSFLQMCARHGVTTMLDMGNREFAYVDKLREVPGAAAVFSVFNIGVAPGSIAWKRMGYPPSAEIKDEKDAKRFVDEQLAWGADYIKMILEDPGRNKGVRFPPEVGRAFVDEAHRHGKLILAHAVSVDSYRDALAFGVDELSHIPYSEALPEDLVRAIADRGVAVVPTIVMIDTALKVMSKAHPHLARVKTLSDRLKGRKYPGFTSAASIKSLGLLYKAGAKVFVGTDANLEDPLTLSPIPYGKALHDELAFFVEAGFSPRDALIAATSAPEEFFGLTDRGRIAPGLRADLMLVRGDPTSDIQAVRNVEKVWVKGVEVSLKDPK